MPFTISLLDPNLLISANMYSVNGGTSWVSFTVATGQNPTALVILPNGRVFVRTYQSTSTYDVVIYELSNFTGAAPTVTEVYRSTGSSGNGNGSLYCTEDGTLVCTGKSASASSLDPVANVYSKDEGATWTPYYPITDGALAGVYSGGYAKGVHVRVASSALAFPSAMLYGDITNDNGWKSCNGTIIYSDVSTPIFNRFSVIGVDSLSV
jgi:hypothetical protein